VTGSTKKRAQDEGNANPYLVLNEGDEDEDEGEDEEPEESAPGLDERAADPKVLNHEEICLDDLDEELGAVSTAPMDSFPPNNRLSGNVRAICALDCEMCETAYGSELTRISIVCPVDGVIFDTLVSPSPLPAIPSDHFLSQVKPTRPIIDYHTKFSGITAQLLAPVFAPLTFLLI
jgi:hypothetical protein